MQICLGVLTYKVYNFRFLSKVFVNTCFALGSDVHAALLHIFTLVFVQPTAQLSRSYMEKSHRKKTIILIIKHLFFLYPSVLISWMFEHDCLDTWVVWGVLFVYVLYFCICTRSAQLSMVPMERRSRNTHYYYYCYYYH